MAEIILPEDRLTRTPTPEEQAAIPDWTNAPEWNKVQLGDVLLPGVAMIKGLKVGVEVETKKAKGSDQPTSKDNGVDPSRFDIELRFQKSDWVEFQNGLFLWNPRRPGRARAPVPITNPWVNGFGIKNVRIITVEGDQPTAKAGAQITIRVEEWFDAPVETKNSKLKPDPLNTKKRSTWEQRQAYLHDARNNPELAKNYPDYIKNAVISPSDQLWSDAIAAGLTP